MQSRTYWILEGMQSLCNSFVITWSHRQLVCPLNINLVFYCLYIFLRYVDKWFWKFYHFGDSFWCHISLWVCPISTEWTSSPNKYCIFSGPLWARRQVTLPAGITQRWPSCIGQLTLTMALVRLVIQSVQYTNFDHIKRLLKQFAQCYFHRKVHSFLILSVQ